MLNTWSAERLLRIQKRRLGPAIDGPRRAANAHSRVQCNGATRCAVRRVVSDVLRGDQDSARCVSRPFAFDFSVPAFRKLDLVGAEVVLSKLTPELGASECNRAEQ